MTDNPTTTDDETAQCPVRDPHTTHMWTWRDEGVRCPGIAAVDQAAAALAELKEQPQAVQAERDARIRDDALRAADHLAAGLGRSATTYARRYEKAAARLRKARRERAREVDAHSGHQREVCEALGGSAVDWAEAISRVRKAVADRDGQRAEVRRLRGRVEELTQERDQAVAHDRQPYPTAWAYEQVCAARTKYQERADKAEAALTRVRDTVAEWHTWAGTKTAIRDIERALSGETGPAPQDSAALDDDPQADANDRQPCGETPRGCHPSHQYMRNGTVYECPGGAVTAEPRPLTPLEQQASEALRAYVAAVVPIRDMLRALGLIKGDDQR